MASNEARDLLERIGALRHRCDLDLLIFFARHPRCLLTSESVAAFLGYDLAQVADSLDVLLSAGLLVRRLTPAHAARMYVFAENGPKDKSIAALVELSSTREGRLAVREALFHLSQNGTGRMEARPGADVKTNGGPGPRALVVQLRPAPSQVSRRPGGNGRSDG